jgi:inner membrane protein involved in colicin E2 resistance
MNGVTETNTGMADLVIYWAYILLIITLVLLLAFPIKFFIANPKQGIRFLIALGGFAVLYGISWALASGATDAAVYETNGITSGVSRMIGAGMIMTYIIGGLALIGLIYSGISKALK